MEKNCVSREFAKRLGYDTTLISAVNNFIKQLYNMPASSAENSVFLAIKTRNIEGIGEISETSGKNFILDEICKLRAKKDDGFHCPNMPKTIEDSSEYQNLLKALPIYNGKFVAYFIAKGIMEYVTNDQATLKKVDYMLKRIIEGTKLWDYYKNDNDQFSIGQSYQHASLMILFEQDEFFVNYIGAIDYENKNHKIIELVANLFEYIAKNSKQLAQSSKANESMQIKVTKNAPKVTEVPCETKKVEPLVSIDLVDFDKQILRYNKAKVHYEALASQEVTWAKEYEKAQEKVKQAQEELKKAQETCERAKEEYQKASENTISAAINTKNEMAQLAQLAGKKF